MMLTRKVIWTEGMFLRPHHFQQQDRHWREQLALRTRALQPFYWGLTALDIDHEALAAGKLALTAAEGILPDGTPFAFHRADDAPAALDVPVDIRDALVVLALPRQRAGATEVSFEESDDPLARYAVVETEVEDSTPGGLEAVLMQIGRPRLRLAFAHDLGDDWIAVGVARVQERRTDHRVVLDDTYIPPTPAAQASPVLAGFVRELAGLLQARGAVLAERLSEPGRGGVSEVADFMLLEVVNRYAGSLWHAQQLDSQHPERLFHDWLMLACTLATYTAADRRPPTLPPYRHDALTETFSPLMDELRRALSVVLEQRAVPIPLHDRGQGLRVGQINDRSLLREAAFVLAVHADLPAEALRAHFPTQAKIGPVDRIRDLVHLQLPGVSVRALPVVPRQIPYRAGHVYFELDTSAELWRQLDANGALALHVAGDFPGLGLEFWAIRD